MMNKHAYLIMAHHRMDLLERLLKALDYENNDIFVHIDKKCKEGISVHLKHAKLFILEREDVRWAGYSQIACELKLLDAALKKGYHQYYHMLTGVSYPIKSNTYILDFFKKNNGKEFVGFDNAKDYSNRLKYYYAFNEMGKPNTFLKIRLEKIRNVLIKIQRKLKIDFFKKYSMVCKKGIAYWSITEDFAKYLINNKKTIKKLMRFSICGDEVFVQTMLYNSNFRNKIYSTSNEFEGSLVDMPWGTSIGEREGHCFNLTDFDYIKKSKQLYALKFENEEGMELLDRIDKEILKNENK